MKKILLLEDDVALHETIKDYLESLNYVVISSFDGDDSRIKVYENNFDLFLFDVNVPNLNGFELLQEIRANQNLTPTIFITSLNGIVDLENGYDSGCDDYIKKPFALKELQLRIETILKREFYHHKSDFIKIDENIFFDMTKERLLIDNNEIQLASKVLKLLKLFLQNKNMILNHEKIENNLWEYGEETSNNAIRTYIKEIRKLIGKEKIVSLKKSGYKFIN
jgi:DNA-binding response OmpR family regulator